MRTFQQIERSTFSHYFLGDKYLKMDNPNNNADHGLAIVSPPRNYIPRAVQQRKERYAKSVVFFEKIWYKCKFMDLLVEGKGWMEAHMMAKHIVFKDLIKGRIAEPYDEWDDWRESGDRTGLMMAESLLLSSFSNMFAKEVPSERKLLYFGFEFPEIEDEKLLPASGTESQEEDLKMKLIQFYEEVNFHYFYLSLKHEVGDFDTTNTEQVILFARLKAHETTKVFMETEFTFKKYQEELKKLFDDYIEMFKLTFPHDSVPRDELYEYLKLY
jgi:hypothetical protein